MPNMKVVAATAALTGLIAAVAYGQSGSHLDIQSTMQAMMPNQADAPAVRDLKSVHMKMMANSPKSFSGDPMLTSPAP
jgi:hypothetical protein